MTLKIIQDDITQLDVDVIVNAANTQLKQGGGVCGAIFQAAGASKLQKACDLLAPIQTSQAVITPGYDLPAKYIIHVAGPIYANYGPDESEALLRASYLNALKLAAENNLKSIAFPLISSGIYGYPKEKAIEIAISAINQSLLKNEMDVRLILFDNPSYTIGKAYLSETSKGKS